MLKMCRHSDLLIPVSKRDCQRISSRHVTRGPMIEILGTLYKVLEDAFFGGKAPPNELGILLGPTKKISICRSKWGAASSSRLLGTNFYCKDGVDTPHTGVDTMFQDLRQKGQTFIARMVSTHLTLVSTQCSKI
ncbi:hypothetical protein Taro_054543 [Colocasia esculenta]|uniref:Uncharacterized protein n=1 Tax=Colocasia esculenta TaxID=4460 RepID=A0A843XQW8_COLES|nr:hypothetical protein [Colocasia esculenta]